MSTKIKGTDNMVESPVKFWDRDGDGIIAPFDVYKGFKELGFNLVISIASMLMYAESQPARMKTDRVNLFEFILVSAEASPTLLRWVGDTR